MARPTTVRWGAGVVYLGDGATPEVFTKVCGFESIDLQIDKSTADTTVADCDDPDAAAWSEKDVTAMSWSMSFAGVCSKEAWEKLEAATFASVSRNLRFDLSGLGTEAGKIIKRYAGKAHITASLTGKRGEKWQISIKADGDGELAPSNVAAA